MTPYYITMSAVLVLAAALLCLGQWYLNPFFRRLAICVIIPAAAALVVIHAGFAYQRGEGGFKLGVDLVGGTILVYEVDPDKEVKANVKDSARLGRVESKSFCPLVASTSRKRRSKFGTNY